MQCCLYNLLEFIGGSPVKYSISSQAQKVNQKRLQFGYNLVTIWLQIVIKYRKEKTHTALSSTFFEKTVKAIDLFSKL